MNTKHLKAKILDLAIRGKLVPQDPSEGNTADLLKNIRKEKNILIEQKKIKVDKNSSFIIKADNGRHYEQFADGNLIDIEDDIPFEIPENWCWCRLTQICEYGKCQNAEPADLDPNSWILDLEDIEKDTGKIKQFKMFEERNSLSTKHVFTEGTVLYSKLRPYLNKVVIAPKDGFCTSEILPLDFQGLYINKFAQRLLMSPYFLSTVNMLTYGVKMPRLGTNEAKQIFVPLPPLSEQQRIVSAIEKAFEQIDIIEKNKLNLKTYIKQTKSKVLDLAIRGKLVEQNPGEGNAFELLEKIRKEKSDLIKQKKLKEDKKSSFIIKSEDGKHYEHFADGSLKDIEDEIPFEIPENWCWCRLREIGNWQSGCTPDKSRKDFYDKADIPWLNSGDLTDGYIENIPHYVSRIAFNEKKMKLNDAGSVCIAMYGATIGKLGILTKPATTNQAVLVCNKLHLSDSKFLFYFLKSHKKEYIQAGFGGAQPNISKEKVEPTLFPLPPLDEQKRIVERIEQIFEQLDILEKSLGE